MDWRTGCTRSTVPITQKHPVTLVKNTHVIWSDVTRTVSLPLPAVAWLGPLACPCGALAPRSKMWRTFAGRAVGRTDLKCTSVACRASARRESASCLTGCVRVRAARVVRVRSVETTMRIGHRRFRSRTDARVRWPTRLPNSEGQGAQNFGVIQFPRNPEDPRP